MLLLLNDIKDIFFKLQQKENLFPLFPNMSTSRGMNQISFLKCFFPEQSFLKRISENVFLGSGTSASQRSNLFNMSLPESRGDNLCAEILNVFDRDLWQEMLLLCAHTIDNGTTEESKLALDDFLCTVITDMTDTLSKNQIDFLLKSSINIKTESVVFLLMLRALYADQTTIQSIMEIIISNNNSQPSSPISVFGEYRYICFGHYPQTVASEKTAQMLTKISPENGIYTLNGEQYIKCLSNLHSDYNIYSGDYIFSNGVPIKNQHEYFFKIEPIVWRILKETENHYLILSDKILDHVLFNTKISRTAYYYSGNYLANSWEGSSLFNWFNRNRPGCFLFEAFTTDEQDQIRETVLSNSSPWKDNDDTCQKIFALSYDEVNEYLLNFSELERKIQNYKIANNDVDLKPCLDAIAFMTDYAICRGVCPCDFGNYLQYFEEFSYFSNSFEILPTEEYLEEICISQGRWKKDEKLKTGTWWLRSPGNPAARFKNFDEQNDYTRRVCDIMEDGHLCERGSNVDGGLFERGRRPESCDGTRNGIRPALYLIK